MVITAGEYKLKRKTKSITINLEAIGKLVKKADEMLLSPSGEKNLLKILDAEEALKKFRDQAQELLEKRAKKLDPSFSVIRGDAIKVIFRKFGSRYAIDESNMEKLPRQLYKRRVSYSPKTKEIDEFCDEHGNLPVGIYESDRPKKIYINRVKS